MAQRYYVRWRGRVTGPFALAELQRLCKQRKVSRAHQISTDRRAWSPAGDLEELFPPPEPVFEETREDAAALDDLLADPSPGLELAEPVVFRDAPESVPPPAPPPPANAPRPPRRRHRFPVAHEPFRAAEIENRLLAGALLGTLLWLFGAAAANGVLLLLDMPGSREVENMRIGWLFMAILGCVAAGFAALARGKTRWLSLVLLPAFPLLLTLALVLDSTPFGQLRWTFLGPALLSTAITIALWVGVLLRWTAPRASEPRTLLGVAGIVGLVALFMPLGIGAPIQLLIDRTLWRELPIAGLAGLSYLGTLVIATLSLAPGAARALRGALTGFAVVWSVLVVLTLWIVLAESGDRRVLTFFMGTSCSALGWSLVLTTGIVGLAYPALRRATEASEDEHTAPAYARHRERGAP